MIRSWESIMLLVSGVAANPDIAAARTPAILGLTKAIRQRLFDFESAFRAASR
jgi:hypothetical protein